MDLRPQKGDTNKKICQDFDERFRGMQTCLSVVFCFVNTIKIISQCSVLQHSSALYDITVNYILIHVIKGGWSKLLSTAQQTSYLSFLVHRQDLWINFVPHYWCVNRNKIEFCIKTWEITMRQRKF